MWGGTHRFYDTALVEAKHRVSLKSNGKKIRVRNNTQTEKDLLRVTQEELVFESVQQLLDDMAEDPPLTVAEEIAAQENVNLTASLHVLKCVDGDQREHLIHSEVLLSWGELFHMFLHCFPTVVPVQQETKWGVYQHAVHELNGKRYHYWGTDTRYPNISRGGVRRRRDMVRVSLRGEHRAEIVCFVKASTPPPSGSIKSPQYVGVLVRWLTPHKDAVMYGGEPTCPGPLCQTHNLWSWHRTNVRRTAISGFRFGRLPDAQKAWLESKREGLLHASYDVVELASIGKYANITPDFCTDGFLESVSWA